MNILRIISIVLENIFHPQETKHIPAKREWKVASKLEKFQEKAKNTSSKEGKHYDSNK